LGRARFLPLWLAVLLAVLAAAMFWRATFRTPERCGRFFADRRGYLRIGAVLGALALVIALLDSWLLPGHAWILHVLASRLGAPAPGRDRGHRLAGSFGVYYVFVHWLAVSLPIGIFGI